MIEILPFGFSLHLSKIQSLVSPAIFCEFGRTGGEITKGLPILISMNWDASFKHLYVEVQLLFYEFVNPIEEIQDFDSITLIVITNFFDGFIQFRVVECLSVLKQLIDIIILSSQILYILFFMLHKCLDEMNEILNASVWNCNSLI